MKKNMKKFASLMLALVMAIGLAAPAFAAPADVEPAADNIRVTLRLKDQTGNIFTARNVSLPAGSTVYDLVTNPNHFPAVEEGTIPTTGSAWNTYGNSKFLQTIWLNDVPYATKGLENAPTVDDKGNPISFLAWKDGYGLINHGTSGYKYYYAGNAWTYTVTGGDLADQDVNTLAMNQFVLHMGNTVTLTYAVQTSLWTQDNPLSQNYPFLPENSAETDFTVTLSLADESGDIVAPTNMTLSAGSTVYDLVTKYFAATNDSAVVNRSEWDTSGSSKFLQTILFSNKTYATKGLEDAPKFDSQNKPPAFEKWEDGKDGLAWKDGYGLINYDAAAKQYTYYYAGYAWMYSVIRNGKPDAAVDTEAMNEYALQQGDAVVLNYKVQTSQWTQSDPLSQNYPYLP